MSLTTTQKIMASVAAGATTTAVIFTLLSAFVETKTEAKIAPIRTGLEDHVASPGHEREMQELREIKETLDYIRGKLDAQWAHQRHPPTPPPGQ